MKSILALGILVLSVQTALATADEQRTDRTAAAEAFVAAQARGDFAAAMKEFDDVMKKASPADKMEATWKLVQKQVGPFQKQLGTRQEKVDPYDIVYVTCQFEKTPLDVRVVFTRDGQITGYSIRPVQKQYDFPPPPYARPDSFLESAMTVGSGEWALPGTLTLPTGAGPFAAVVLVHGSGPNDRDETIGPNKPFRDLAWGLASQGIAVLRYDKRTKAHAAKMAERKDKITIKDEAVDDAIAAAALLRTRKEIDPKRIYLLGHSLGAFLGPQIGLRDPDLKGLILLAGNTRPLEDVILEQMTYLLSLEGALGKEETEQLDKVKKQVRRVKDPTLTPETPASELPLRSPAAYWLALRDYRPTEVVAQFRRPVLVLQGERDYQVTMTDFEGWKKALGARPEAKLKSYPKLNHLFMEGEGKAKPDEYERAGHVSPEVVDDIAHWIKGGPGLRAADAGPPTGFTSLFNGNDLAGWKVNEGGKLDRWGAADGLLFTKGSGGGWLMSDEEYDDFELLLEFRLPRAGNSGVALRSALKGAPHLEAGMEIQILDDPWYLDEKNYKGLKPTQRTGSLYGVVPPAKEALKPIGEWNAFRIVARGRNLTVELNGVTVVDTNLDDHKEAAKEHAGILRTKGHIGLQSHDGRIEFRRLSVKRL